MIYYQLIVVVAQFFLLGAYDPTYFSTSIKKIKVCTITISTIIAIAKQ
jgi:hypothetical protein